MAIQAFAPTVGGGELQLERLLPRLKTRGVRSVVLTRAVAGTPRRDVVAGTEVYRTSVAGESPVASITYVVSSLAYLARRWRSTDVVHAHGALSPATIGVAARLFGKPCVVTVLGAGPPGDLARLRRKFAGRRRMELLVRHARFVALSAEVRDELQRAGVPPAHVVLVPNGVDVREYRPATEAERCRLRVELGLAPDRGYGVFVGRLHPVKSVDTLLHALAGVAELDLVIVGSGPEREGLEALARQLGVDERVRFVGMTHRVADYLRAADAFFLPSLGEGMSNALLEAMACGLACVVTEAVGGIDELLGRGRGITVPVRDVRAWTDAMRRLAGDATLRAELGRAAADHVGSTLSIEATADRLAAFYREVATRP
jgi:glycosyltransferase involved in cell wall biosynthesis